MSALTINTTQNVAIAFGMASVGARILAFLIDMLIKIGYIVCLILLFSNVFKPDTWGVDNWGFAAIMMVILSPILLYSLVLEALMEGQTIGKRIMRIKVVKIDGFQAGLGDYFTRWIMRMLDINLVNGVVGLISIIVTDHNQRLGDIAAGTAVITLKKSTAIQHTIFQDLQETYQPKYPAAAYLSDKDARIIKRNLEQAQQQADYILLNALRQKVEDVLKIKKGAEDDITFLRAILTDFNFYTQGVLS